MTKQQRAAKIADIDQTLAELGDAFDKAMEAGDGDVSELYEQMSELQFHRDLLTNN